MSMQNTPSNIDLITEFVYTQNNKKDQHTPYCPKNKETIKKELVTAFNQDCLHILNEDEEIKGVVFYFKTPLDTFDVMGPFVRNNDHEVAKTLLDEVRNKIGRVKLNFFFNDGSHYYLELMKYLEAILNEREYHLTLSKALFAPVSSQITIKKPGDNDKDLVKEMHDTIFKDVYITGDMLIKEERYKNVQVLYEDESAIGYALLEVNTHQAYLEVFGLIKAYRGQGKASPFLSKIIEEAFKDEKVNTVSLIVDVINNKALNLYKKLGFEVSASLLSYTT